MRNILNLLSLLIVSSLVSAQTKLSGKILSEVDSTAIQYAHVSLVGTGIGTYTNTLGKFELYIEDSLGQASIEISSIGYNRKQVSINFLILDSLILLTPSIELLDEVIINAYQDSLGRIVQNALKKIKKNYSNKQHLLECFYREAIQKDGKYARLIEAAVSVQDKGIKSPTDRNLIKIHELRKSNSYYKKSILSRMLHLLLGKENELYELYNKNLVRKYYPNRNDKIIIYSKRFLDFFDFSLQEIIIADGDSILTVNYYPKHIINSYVESLPDSVFAVIAPYGKLYISMNDFGIIEWINKLGVVAGSGIPDEAANRSYFNQKDSKSLHIKYRKYQGKYFLSFVKEVRHIDPYTFRESFLMVNQIITDRSQFKKIKKRNALKKSVDIYSSEFEYNQEFWNNYTILLENPLKGNIRNDLYRSKILEEQFKDNSKN